MFMLIDGRYDFRFGPREEKVDAIWCETEIAKRFEEVIEKNKELISNQVTELRESLSSFFEDEKFKSLVLDDKDKKFESLIWDDKYVISEILGNTKFKILRLAINEVFAGRFDVKQNILDILNSDNRVEDILRERVKATLEAFKEPRLSKLRFSKLSEDIDKAIAESTRDLNEEIGKKIAESRRNIEEEIAESIRELDQTFPDHKITRNLKEKFKACIKKRWQKDS